jgi:hypothetical protein
MTKLLLTLAAACLVANFAKAGTEFVVKGSAGDMGLEACVTHEQWLALDTVYKDEGLSGYVDARDVILDQMVDLLPGTVVWVDRVYRDGSALIRVRGSSSFLWIDFPNSLLVPK